MKRKRIRIRLYVDIDEAIDREAVWQGIKVGTLTNKIIQEELNKIEAVGLKNCLIQGTSDYNSKKEKIEKNPQQFYLIPAFTIRERYTPSNGRGIETGSQVSLYVTEEQLSIIRSLAKIEKIRGTWKYDDDGAIVVTSYRYILVGLLLNNPILSELMETRK